MLIEIGAAFFGNALCDSSPVKNCHFCYFYRNELQCYWDMTMRIKLMIRVGINLQVSQMNYRASRGTLKKVKIPNTGCKKRHFYGHSPKKFTEI